MKILVRLSSLFYSAIGNTTVYYIPNGNISDHGKLTFSTKMIADYFKKMWR